MKNFKLFLIATMAVLLSSNLTAQNPKTAILEIKTSARCGMCKATLEKALSLEKGVVNSNLDLETKVLKVTYKPEKITPENIRKAVSATGYDADDVVADPKAYANLPGCCKKPENSEYEK